MVVIGAGIAGLSAAYDLHRHHAGRIIVLEAGSRAGGNIFSEQIDGFVIDAGPDSILVEKPAALELCHELGLSDHLIVNKRPRVAYVLRAQRLYPLPEAAVFGIPTRVGALTTFGLFSTAGKLRILREVLYRSRDERLSDESIAAFFRRHFGEEAVAYLAEPLLAGIHAGDVERLSMRALFPRLAQTEDRFGSLLRGFRSFPRPASADGPFRSLSGGMGSLVAALVRTLPLGMVRLGTRAVAIEATRPPESVEQPRQQSGSAREQAAADGEARNARYVVRLASGEAIGARGVVLATPAYVTADLVQSCEAELADSCRGIRYASTATVSLAYDRTAVRHPLSGTGFVVPHVEPERQLLAASWTSSKWPGRAPPEYALLRGFVGGLRDPDVLSLSDEALRDLVHSSLARILEIKGTPVFSRVYRWERASPQHEVGHMDRVATIDRTLLRWPGLYVTGSAFRGVGIPDCIADGRATASRMARFLAEEKQQ